MEKLPLYMERDKYSAKDYLEFFNAKRALQAGDYLKPRYHFTSPINQLNDPNGICYFKGKWHLFHQLGTDGTVFWAHAVSDDLIHWQDMPPALFPQNEFACWSGATCVEEDRVIAMYYGYPEGIMIAVSNDKNLEKWERLQREPVIKVSDLPPIATFSIPDPYIWKEDGVYYALIGGSKAHETSGDGMRQMYLYSSNDLYNWKYEKDFLSNNEFSEVNDDGACPYFKPIGEKHLLMHYSHRHGTKYLLGVYDKKTHSFIPENGGSISKDCWFGGVHAPSITPYEDGILGIFNINCSEFPVTWDNQMMTLPRKYSLYGNCNNFLKVNVIDAVSQLREKHIRISGFELKENKEYTFEGVEGNTVEFIAEFSPKKVPLLEIKVMCSDDNSEYTNIQFFPRRSNRYYKFKDGSDWGKKEIYESVLIVDPSHCCKNGEVFPVPPVREDIYLDPRENIKIRVFVDNSVVEVFVNDSCAAAVRAYPSRPDSNKIKFSSVGKSTEITSLDFWNLKSIYTE